MLSTRLRVVGLSLAISILSSMAIADGGQQQSLASHPGQIQNDAALVAAVHSKQNQFFVEAGDLVVTAILPDDTQGLPHQKWEAQLSDGSVVMIVYNSDMGDRVPVQVGEHFSVGGQFIWTSGGGLVHWVHADPKKKRPDGYVFVDNVVYGAIGTGSEARNLH